MIDISYLSWTESTFVLRTAAAWEEEMMFGVSGKQFEIFVTESWRLEKSGQFSVIVVLFISSC